MKAVLHRTVLAASLVLSASAVAAQTTHTVTMAGFSFSPSTVNIDLGDTVTFVWAGGLHNVESGTGGVPDGAFSSGAPTTSSPPFSVTFDAAFLNANPRSGNFYPFYCITHLGFGMTGTVAVNAPLSVNTATIDLSAGGSQNMFLNASPLNAVKLYWIVGSASGITPGFPPLPLNFDAYMLFTIQFPNTLIQGSLGVLDGGGIGVASITLPPGSDPTLAGIKLDHAFAVVEIPSGAISFVSNPMPLRFVP